jgi:hypothetical protein
MDTASVRSCWATVHFSNLDRKPLLPPAFFTELGYAFIVSDKRTVQFYRRGDQKPVRWIPIFEMLEPVAAGGGVMCQRYALYTWPVQETLNPIIDRNIELNPSCIDEQGDFPGRHRTEEYCSAILPAIVDQGPGRTTQPIIAAIEP